MFRQLLKQIWFVVLMVFAIGWSGMSVASARTMHLQMPAEQFSTHCQKIAETGHLPAPPHMAMPGMAHELPQQPDCPSELKSHADDGCPDCHSTSCHSLGSWMEVEIPGLSLPQKTSFTEKTGISAYYAQHLAGYWQEILRPPKA